MNEDELGYIEYYGEIIPITWNSYINIIWNKDPHIEIVKVPKRPECDRE